MLIQNQEELLYELMNNLNKAIRLMGLLGITVRDSNKDNCDRWVLSEVYYDREDDEVYFECEVQEKE